MSVKSVLRAEVDLRRSGLPAEERASSGQAIEAAVMDLWMTARRVAAYAAVGSEPPTAGLITARPDVLLPVLLPTGDLDWAAGDLRKSRLGLLEPTGPRLGPGAVGECDLVLVPALAVDATGHRLGRGGGSYDRALLRATGLTVALLYDGELVDCVPSDAHDVPVAAVLTPSLGLQRVTSF
ncbi:MAG: 5-formyltetrahydrofolate cyclo-ligase [Mycobacteriales bacterium]